MEEVKSHKDVTELIDEFEAAILKHPQIDCPVRHIFTPGLYTREIIIPAGTILTSKIHKTEHPFLLSAGSAKVWTEEAGYQLLEAPYLGVTKPGTRRVIHTITNVIWTTFHPTENKTVEEVEEEIIEKHDNKFISAKEMEEIK